MIALIDRERTIKVNNRIRLETDNWIFEIYVEPVTGNLEINKVDGIENGSMSIFPRVTNVIEIS